MRLCGSTYGTWLRLASRNVPFAPSGVLYDERAFVRFLVQVAHADLERKSKLNETPLYAWLCG